MKKFLYWLAIGVVIGGGIWTATQFPLKSDLKTWGIVIAVIAAITYLGVRDDEINRENVRNKRKS